MIAASTRSALPYHHQRRAVGEHGEENVIEKKALTAGSEGFLAIWVEQGHWFDQEESQ